MSDRYPELTRLLGEQGVRELIELVRDTLAAEQERERRERAELTAQLREQRR